MHEGQPPNPGQRPPPAARYHNWLLLLVLAAGAFTILGGAGYMVWNTVSRGGPRLSTYLCSNGGGETGVALLRWPQGGAGVVSGTYRDAKITGIAPDERLSTGSGALSGHVSGSSVSLEFGGVQLHGKLAVTLTLDMPQRDGALEPVTCKQAAGIAGWNRALANLNAAVSQDNQLAARWRAQQAARWRAQQAARWRAQQAARWRAQQAARWRAQQAARWRAQQAARWRAQQAARWRAQQAARWRAQQAARWRAQQVARAQTRLARDIATLSRHTSALDNDTSLGDVIQAMKNELAAAQGDLRAERQEACNDGKAGRDAVTVSADLGTVQSRISTLRANSVPHDLTAVRNDVRTVQSLGAAVGTAPSAAIAQGQQALSNLASAASWTQQDGQTLNQQAQQIAARESHLPDSGCRTPQRSAPAATSSAAQRTRDFRQRAPRRPARSPPGKITNPRGSDHPVAS